VPASAWHLSIVYYVDPFVAACMRRHPRCATRSCSVSPAAVSARELFDHGVVRTITGGYHSTIYIRYTPVLGEKLSSADAYGSARRVPIRNARTPCSRTCAGNSC